MKRFKWIFILMFLVAYYHAGAQFDPSKICRVEDGNMSFTLQKSWTHSQKLEVAHLFDLDTTLVLNIYNGKDEITAGGSTWKIIKVNSDVYKIIKPLVASSSPTNTGNVIILDDRWMNAYGVNKRESETFGVNRFTLFNVFSYRNGKATFYIPKRQEAKQIFLAGTFNNWSTRQTPMTKTDSGWIVTVKLSPGKYTYKFIVDGKWMEDPYNKLHENDHSSWKNSVVFCYNYRFFLKGFQNSKNVRVAGSFNGWNTKQLPMVRTSGGWVLYMFLREGTHSYKFIVDGEWIPDPVNKANRQDGRGNVNSYVAIGDTFYFRLKGHLETNRVIVAGNFNEWNDGEMLMRRTKTGWEMPYVLAPGNYEYKFILDGTWITDPDNPYTVISGGVTNSYLTIKPNHTFILDGYTFAKKVVVTGNFSGWSPENYQMIIRDNHWVLPIHLSPGKYTYKFIVDNKWIEDPDNNQWESNEYNTKNSVLWIEP
ncbi:MAG: hypothetical protein Q8867_06100 [Bacteroidota bacterium]|nr:hypothetical protein [Bacteroidota bacterium]